MRASAIAWRRPGRWLGGAVLAGGLLAAGTAAIAVAGGGRHKRGPGDYTAAGTSGPPATPTGTDERATRSGRALRADGGPDEAA